MRRDISDENAPLFSVIVPVYNTERYLPQCLDSLVNQTFRDMEIIVVDDGSTDGSGKLCDEYAEKYDCVFATHQEHLGSFVAKNAGLVIAKGAWLSFVNSTDMAEPDMLERLAGYILMTGADLYCFNAKLSSEMSDITSACILTDTSKMTSLSDERDKFRYCFDILLQGGIGHSVCSGIYRSRIIREHGIRFTDPDIVGNPDLLFRFQYLLYARKVMRLSDVLYEICMRVGNAETKAEEDTESETDKAAEAAMRLKRIATLAKEAYQLVERGGMTYFCRNFYRLYFMILNPCIKNRPPEFDDRLVRKTLDMICEDKFHRDCIGKIRKNGSNFKEYTQKCAWIKRSFGKTVRARGRGQLCRTSTDKPDFMGWGMWLFLLNINLAARGLTAWKYDVFLDRAQRTAYLINAKAACSSIKVSMLKRDDIPDDYTIHRMLEYSTTHTEVFRREGWYSFTFVRNPFTRLVSCYESKYHADLEQNKAATKYGVLDFDHYLEGYMKEDRGFEYFIDKVVRMPYRLANKHFLDQYHMIVGKDGKPLVDFVGKFESLSEDYEPIREKYGYDPLKTYNRAEYGDWRDYYTTKLAKKVYRKYKKDFSYFGYEQEYRDLMEYLNKKRSGGKS